MTSIEAAVSKTERPDPARSGALRSYLLIAPAVIWMALFLVLPLAMIIYVSFWTQSTFNAKGEGNPFYRTLFNMAVLVLTIQVSGHVFLWLGGQPGGDLLATAIPLLGMTATYFLANTICIALAIALTTNQNAWRIWKSDFASSAPSYLIGAVASAVTTGCLQW